MIAKKFNLKDLFINNGIIVVLVLLSYLHRYHAKTDILQPAPT